MLSDIGQRIAMRSTTTKYSRESLLINITITLLDSSTMLPLMISRFVFASLCSLNPISLSLFPVCFWKVALQYDTKYFYEIGSGDATRRFFFTTPPMVGPDAPYTFGIIGNCWFDRFLPRTWFDRIFCFVKSASLNALPPQAILDRLMIRIKRLSIIIQIRMDKQCCSSEIFLTRTIIRFTITESGIHGVDLSRRALRTNRGFGPPVTTKWILLQKL